MPIPDQGELNPSAGGLLDPRQLEHMLGPVIEAMPLWADAELRDIFQHQLKASLALDLSCGNPAEFNVIWLEASRAAPSPRTFGELFEHPMPPLELLLRVKEFAKSASCNVEASLPRGIAAFLYQGAIAAARVRHGARITGMSDAALSAGCRSLLASDWLDLTSRELLESAVRLIAPPP